MLESDDTVIGVLVGINLTRHKHSAGWVAGLDNFIVRLEDGREIVATEDLPPLKHPWMLRQIDIGSRVKIKLGTVLEPIRVIELFDSED